MTVMLEDVAAAIVSIVPTEPIVYPSNAEPPTPDNILTLYNTGGAAGALTLSGDLADEERTVQLRFRDRGQGPLQGRVEAAYSALKTWQSYAPVWMRFKASSSPLYAYAKDQAGRSIASFNLTVKAGR